MRDFGVLARDVGIHQLQIGGRPAADDEHALVDRHDTAAARVGHLEAGVHQTGFAFSRPTWTSRPVKS